MKARRFNSGFTLLELSVVLIIISLVVAGGIMATLGVLDSAKRAATESKLDTIERALMAFRLTYNRLPCPSDISLNASSNDYGEEAANQGTCAGGTPAANKFVMMATGGWGADDYAAAEGGVPTRTLGLPDEFMVDGWGRRLTYAVRPKVTFDNSFDYYDATPSGDTQCNTNNGLPNDGSYGLQVWRDMNYSTVPFAYPVYVLMSSGPNGHGAYSSNGTVLNFGATNANELENCHCTSAAVAGTYDGYYVSKLPSGDIASLSNNFDDIVRYKERWQMPSYEERYLPNRWPFVVKVHGIVDNSPFISQRCQSMGIYGAQPSVVIGTTTTILKFTPNESHVFSVSQSVGCQLNKVNYNRDTYIVSLTAVATPASCPTWDAGNVAAVSDNGIIAMTKTTSPYIQFWQQSGDVISYQGAGTVSPAPSARPTLVAFSKGAEYLFLSDGSTYSRVYRRHGNSYIFRALTSQPAGMINTPTAVAFSPITANGEYLAVANNTLNLILMWKIGTGSTFTATTSQNGPAAGVLTFLDFSADGQYMATGGGAGQVVYNQIRIYKIEANNSFIVSLIDGTENIVSAVPITSAGFFFDNRILAIVGNPYGWYLYRTGTTRFMLYVTSGGAGAGQPAAYRNN